MPVICRECNRDCGDIITRAHLKRHKITLKQYINDYGEDSVTSPEFRLEMKRKYSLYSTEVSEPPKRPSKKRCEKWRANQRKYWENPEHRLRVGERVKKYWAENPEKRIATSIKSSETKIRRNIRRKIDNGLYRNKLRKVVF